MTAEIVWIVMLAVSVVALLALAWASDRLIKAQRDLIEHQSTMLETSRRILATQTETAVIQTIAEDETFIPELLAMFRTAFEASR